MACSYILHLKLQSAGTVGTASLQSKQDLVKSCNVVSRPHLYWKISKNLWISKVFLYLAYHYCIESQKFIWKKFSPDTKTFSWRLALSTQNVPFYLYSFHHIYDCIWIIQKSKLIIICKSSMEMEFNMVLISFNTEKWKNKTTVYRMLSSLEFWESTILTARMDSWARSKLLLQYIERKKLEC